MSKSGTHNVLLTGATGFVGRQIFAALKRSGAHVTVVTRNKADDLYSEDQVTTADMFSETVDWWATQLEGITTVIHAGWYVEPGKYLFSDENQRCLEGSLALVDAFAESDAEHFVGVGTCFEYDLSYGLLDVETPLAPNNPYAEAKVALYEALKKTATNASKSYAWCRLFYLYGENEHASRLVPYLHQQLAAGERVELTSGKQVRDFMDVKDAGVAIARVAMDRLEGAQNICSGEAITVRQLAEKIADEYGRRDLLVFGAREDNAVDPPKVVGIPWAKSKKS